MEDVSLILKLVTPFNIQDSAKVLAHLSLHPLPLPPYSYSVCYVLTVVLHHRLTADPSVS